MTGQGEATIGTSSVKFKVFLVRRPELAAVVEAIDKCA